MESTSIPELLTIDEAARRLTVKASTVRSWIAKGRITRVKLGRCVRIPVSAIAEFIEAGTERVQDAPGREN